MSPESPILCPRLSLRPGPLWSLAGALYLRCPLLRALLTQTSILASPPAPGLLGRPAGTQNSRPGRVYLLRAIENYFIPQNNWKMNPKLWGFQVFLFLNTKIKVSINWVGNAGLGHVAFCWYNKDTLCLLGPEATSTVGICPHQGGHVTLLQAGQGRGIEPPRDSQGLSTNRCPT